MRKFQYHKAFLAGSIVIAVFFFLLPLIYAVPDYASLQTKEIAVSRTGYHASKGSVLYYLITTDGERMEIRGEVDYDVLKALEPGSQVTVKYYNGAYVLWRKDFIREMTKDGQYLVAYAGDQQRENLIVTWCIGAVSLIVGFTGYWAETKWLKKEAERRRRRKERRKRKKEKKK